MPSSTHHAQSFAWATTAAVACAGLAHRRRPSHIIAVVAATESVVVLVGWFVL
ncbi:hypothetical protein DM02DRAFT_618986 [Periconia macrospinosa]|uniref:Uncharacterized protein n=1 Tax=Periconia macrospinosa TaxID=97972 RepID=A0A2V1D741_9PLEO|nr:hypothetical protein DM02DRAFT_618986 [Periconia macrospinosa]